MWRSAPSYPVAPTGQVTANGSGWLGISGWLGSGLLGIAATPAANAVDIDVPPPSAPVEALTDPTLSLTYRGLATQANAPVFAQLVNRDDNSVLDNQATAVPLVLDGQTHTVTLPLNMVVWALTPDSHISLQITDSSDLFFAQQAGGLVHFLHARLTIPTSPQGPAD